MHLLPSRTPELEAFVAPARAAPALWRLGLGAGLMAALWLAATALALALAARLPVADPRAPLAAFLFGFAGLVLGAGLAARLLQRRSFRTLIGPGGLRPIGFGLGVAAVAVVAAVTLPPVLALVPPSLQHGLVSWVAWLPLALAGLLVQCAGEEIAFRGFLMQGLAARFRSPLVWWVLPAVLFGALHWSPEAFGRDSWLVALGAGIVGLVLGDVTARTGNLSAAIGLHFANNTVALLLVATPSPVSGLSLALLTVGPGDSGLLRLLLLLDLATTLLAYGVWLAVVARRRRLQSRDPGSI